MRILVTGGAGFIGSHLSEFLINRGHEVICLDNFFTGQRKNIEQLEKSGRFSVMEHDVTEPFFVPVDEIYNLACPASPVHYQKDPIKTTNTSILGAIHCLELSIKLGGIKVLQASTSEVYGDPSVHPQTEDYNGNVSPIGPRACYDEGKRCAETLCFDYYRQAAVPIRVVRIFNTYGPNMAVDDGRVVSNFIIQALRGEDITIYGDGRQTRSFCYVTDLIRGLYAMMDAKDCIGPVNLGNPGEFTMMELANLVLELTESKSKIVKRPLPEDDPRQRQPDISLANKQLSWKPEIALRDGLEKTIEYFRRIV